LTCMDFPQSQKNSRKPVNDTIVRKVTILRHDAHASLIEPEAIREGSATTIPKPICG
jgi:hypothetical protein